MMIIQGKKGRDKYYYDKENLTVSDKEGNCIKLYESLEEVCSDDLVWYLDILFHNLYRVSNEFKDNCIFSKNTKIKWGDLDDMDFNA